MDDSSAGPGSPAPGCSGLAIEARLLETRTSRAIVIVPRGARFLVFNFLAKTAFTCAAGALELLALLDDWKTTDEVAGLLPHLSQASIARETDRLIGLHALVARDSAYARREERFLESWEWGLPSALFHFSLADREFIPGGEAVRRQNVRSVHDPSPQLYQRPPLDAAIVALPPGAKPAEALLALMARRRTIRSSAGRPIDREQLADCLFAGLGITGEVLTETGRLPLAMTPSGGARNPFEAYVYAREVSGLKSGFYHYAAADRVLSRLPAPADVLPSALLAGQPWTDEMPCLILLVAHFERTMWKYGDPNGYRVVMIEAGHIGQNIMLAATAHGLAACPTAALCHGRIEATLGLSAPTLAPVYALTLSHPGQDDAAILPIPRLAVPAEPDCPQVR